QPEPRHIGWRKRRDVLPAVNDPPRRWLQELGQKIEARRLARTVRADQRMNAATANPQIHIPNSNKTRELLRQFMGLKYVLVRQALPPSAGTISPARPIRGAVGAHPGTLALRR